METNDNWLSAVCRLLARAFEDATSVSCDRPAAWSLGNTDADRAAHRIIEAAYA